MRTKLLLLFLVLIFAVKNLQAGISGPTIVCPGETGTYTFYPDTYPNCQVAFVSVYFNEKNIANTYAEKISNGYRINVTWPGQAGYGRVEISGSTCGFPAQDVRYSISVKIGEAPLLSSNMDGICNSAEGITLTASGKCSSFYRWEVSSGWYFTHNGSNVIENGPNMVILKASPGTNPGAVASVTLKAVYAGGYLSPGAYANFNYHYATIPAPVITGGPKEVCNTSGEQVYFYNGVSNCTIQWSLSPTDAATLVWTNGGYCRLKFNPSAAATIIYLNLKLTNRCGGTATSSLPIYFSTSLPSWPPTPQGPSPVCNQGALAYYTVGRMASNLVYSINPSSAVASSTTSVYGQLNVDWNNSFTGTARMTVRQTNGCGTSQESGYKDIVIVNGVCREDDSLIETATTPDSWSAYLYPNPAKESAVLYINDAFSETASVQVFDSRGIVVYSKDNVAVQNDFAFGENLPSGIYMVKVSNGSGEKVVKFVKE